MKMSANTHHVSMEEHVETMPMNDFMHVIAHQVLLDSIVSSNSESPASLPLQPILLLQFLYAPYYFLVSFISLIFPIFHDYLRSCATKS